MLTEVNMTRKQIAFRIDGEKASKLKEKIENEGKSLNTVLERLVDAYLAGELTDDNSTVTSDNNELTSGDGSAIALLTERIDQLEKMLTPVTELLTLNQPRSTANTKLASANTGNFGFTANSEVTGANNEVTDANTELPDANNEVTDANSEDSVNSELPSANSEDSVNSELPSANSEDSVNSELPSANSEVTDGNSELTGANTEVTGGNSENLDHPTENIPSESTLETTKPTSQDKNHLTETELPQKAKTEDNLSEGINSKDFLKDSEESAIAPDIVEDTGEAFLYRGVDGGYAVIPFSEMGDNDSQSEVVADWLANNPSEHSISQDDLENGGYNLEATVDADYSEGEESAIAPLNQNKLAKRMNCFPNTILNNKRKGNKHFAEWSRKKDPEGISWEYNPENKKFYPIE